MKYLALLLIFSITLKIQSLYAQKQDYSQVEIMVCGDIFPSPSLINSGIQNDGKRNYLPYYEYVTNILQSADLAMAWFGGPVAEKNQNFSGYPVYNNPPEFIVAAIEAGFDVFLHTNHLLDRGIKALLRTIEFYRSHGSIYLGAYSSKDESEKIYYFEKNNIKIAILSYLYGANSSIKTPSWMINYIDPEKIKKDIEKAKKENADFIVVCLHWGEEYERYPNENQKKLARLISSFGADMILGSHPHVLQPAELVITTNNGITHSTFVIYSFGNFLSSQRKRYTDCGIIARFIIRKENQKGTYLFSKSYIPTWVKWEYKSGKKKYLIRVLPIIKTIKDYEQGKFKILSKYEYEKMKIALNDTIAHLDNKEILFLHEEK